MAQLLRQSGFELSHDEPDLIFVNTCCVTGRAEAKSRRFVGRLAKKFPSARIIAAGCLAELKSGDLVTLSSNIRCLSASEKDKLKSGESLLDASLADPHEKTAHACHNFGLLRTPMSQDRSRAFLKIQDGCSQHCSYCIVPTTRGPSRSKYPAQALEDIIELQRAGFPETVLTGIHLGAYGKDLDPKSSLDEFVAGAMRIIRGSRLRLSSIEPQEISASLIKIVAADSRICNHFHVPVQSMDDGILNAMRRPYSSTMVMELISTIFHKIPDACVGADIMVGFPGEDDESFKRTYNALADSGISYLHVFPFSPRPGVPAARMKGVPDRKLVSQRVMELRNLSKILRNRFYDRFVGRELQACLETGYQETPGIIHARTDNYILAQIPKPEIQSYGGLFTIRVECVEEDCVRAMVM